MAIEFAVDSLQQSVLIGTVAVDHICMPAYYTTAMPLSEHGTPGCLAFNLVIADQFLLLASPTIHVRNHSQYAIVSLNNWAIF